MESFKGPELTVPTDKILVQAVLTGEKAAYEALYNRYAPLVRAVCYDAAGNLSDAQDLTQDVFMRAYDKLEHLREQALFGRWIVAMARLRCKEWRREKTRTQERQTGLNDTHAISSEDSNDGQLERLRSAIRKLPTKERLALHTFYLQENSVEDARRMFGLSRSGFYRVLERARRRLVVLLSQ